MSHLYWSSPQRSMLGGGEVRTSMIPGAAGRYPYAREVLAKSGRPIGFASFHFHPLVPGSLVSVPEELEYNLIPDREGPIPPGIVVRDGRPDWVAGYRSAMRAIRQGTVEKVVLARQVDVEFPDDVPVGTVVSNLIDNNPATHVFSIEGLVGASPELLISVEDRVARSTVLAGTSTTSDGLDNPKMSEEHRHAADSVRTALDPLTSYLTAEESVATFGQISHLATSFEGLLGDGVDILDLVDALHPTAAVAGTPTDRALELIEAIEPRSRQRYAGPVGWFDTDGNGEFALALRCGLIRPGGATLYAGGGLVSGSDRDAEWAETELKLGPMMRALALS